jgi:D-threo-aldose 1-dehydrogenase
MPSRPLRRGPALTELGFGGAQLGNLYRETSDEDANQAVDAAWEAGIRYFDTAPHYGVGLSERRLGVALRARPREEYLLSTKVGRSLVPTPERAAAGELDAQGFVTPATHRREWDFSRDAILRSVEQSLTRLDTDRLDIAYLHDLDDHWTEASTTGVATLIELREQGVVSAIGAGMNQSAMPTRLIEECDVDVIMLAGRYTLLDRSGLADLLPLAEERGVGIVAAAVYNSGLLSSARVPDDARFDYGQAPRETIERARAIAAICDSFGVALPEAAIQFPLHHPAVVSVVTGMRTAGQVRSTVSRYEAPLPADLWDALQVVA